MPLTEREQIQLLNDVKQVVDDLKKRNIKMDDMDEKLDKIHFTLFDPNLGLVNDIKAALLYIQQQKTIVVILGVAAGIIGTAVSLAIKFILAALKL